MAGLSRKIGLNVWSLTNPWKLLIGAGIAATSVCFALLQITT